MKSLRSYIQEGILDSEETVTTKVIILSIVDRLLNKQKLSRNEIDTLEKAVAVWKPKDKDNLSDVINIYIKQAGNKCTLNWIDVSEITNMDDMFYKSQFNGDISEWNVSNVRYMRHMFQRSYFNGDMSKWDISKVKDMSFMFFHSYFNGDISKWDVSNVKDMGLMFCDSKFNQDISKWDVSNVKDMEYMFKNSDFNSNISNWKINHICKTEQMFDGCPIKEEYKPKKYKH